MTARFRPTRRWVLGSAGAVVASAVLARPVAAAPGSMRLTAATGTAHLVNDPAVTTPVWCYDGTVPGPLVRARQGQGVRVTVENGLDEPTTVHWHGLRGANAMDGVPYLTQPPIEPGQSFVYDLETPDAGVFWYHPHLAGSRQIGRGLYGAVVVDGDAPADVDRDMLWVLDDWRLDETGAIHESFGNRHDGSHAGRLGNVATINGTPQETFAVAPGERVRLRLLNVANARVFGLSFEGLEPWLAARDGHAIAPVRLGERAVTLGPGARADLVIDVPAEAGAEYAVVDGHYARARYRLAVLVADGPARAPRTDAPAAEAPNPVPEPDLGDPVRFELAFAGGAMRGFDTGVLDGETLDFRTLVQRGWFWTVNGVVRPPMGPAHPHEPLAEIPLGRTAVVRIVNDTAFEHPVHLHGFAFRVLSVNGEPPALGGFLDTVLVGPDDTAEIAFVCDRPGDWAFHCHILEHQETGMMGFVRVV